MQSGAGSFEKGVQREGRLLPGGRAACAAVLGPTHASPPAAASPAAPQPPSDREHPQAGCMGLWLPACHQYRLHWPYPGPGPAGGPREVLHQPGVFTAEGPWRWPRCPRLLDDHGVMEHPPQEWAVRVKRRSKRGERGVKPAAV